MTVEVSRSCTYIIDVTYTYVERHRWTRSGDLLGFDYRRKQYFSPTYMFGPRSGDPQQDDLLLALHNSKKWHVKSIITNIVEWPNKREWVIRRLRWRVISIVMVAVPSHCKLRWTPLIRLTDVIRCSRLSFMRIEFRAGPFLRFRQESIESDW